jgi:hypothetical protein
MTRYLSERDLAAAQEILDRAETFVNARNSEIARRWQLIAAAVVCAMAFLAGAIFWIERVCAVSVLGTFAFDALMGSCAGAVGAMISLLLRIRQMSFDVSAGREVHLFDGATRVLAGMAGAFVVTLAQRVNLIAGIINSLSHPFVALILVCVIAGASERLVPDLINQLERTFHSGTRGVGTN